MGELSYTAGGDSNLVSFKSAARVPITSLKAHFKPKQDLHGYSKPWPAGGGKNLFNKENSIIDGFVHSTTGAFCPESIGEQCIVSDYLEAGTYTISKISSTRFRVGVYATPNPSAYEECYEYYTANPMTSTSFTITTTHNGYFVIFCFNGENNETHTTKEIADTVQIEKGSAATSYEPYENICPIKGWNNCSNYIAKKNIGRIIGYSASSVNSPTAARVKTGIYGNSINTTTYSLPDTSVTITQTQWPNTNNITSYNNGYFCVAFDNLIFGQKYDFSFKITNITNNPLGVTLNNIRIGSPKSMHYASPQIINDNILLFKNVTWEQYTASTTGLNRCTLVIYNCGMSFTLSEMMVTQANISDGIFEPYCGEVIPVTFPITGKNKFDYSNADIANIKRRDDNGDEVTDASGSYCQLLIPVIPNTTYTLSGYTNNNVSKRIYFIQEDETFISRTAAFGNDSYTFTTPNNCYYIQIQNREIANAGWETVQLELGDTATAYEPYSADNTFYGGYVDIAKGEVVAEYGILNLGSLTWSLYSNNTNRQAWYAWANGLKPKTGSDEIANCYSTIFTPTTRAALWKPYYMCTPNYASSNLLIFFNPDQYNDGTEVQNAVNGIPLIYELLEPVHYPISSSQITALLGPNNFYSNTNSTTEVSYAIHDTAPIRAAKYRIAANEPHVETIESSLAHFETDMVAPLKECKVHFEPVQEGSGNASPDNVRNISGWNGVNIHRDNANLINLLNANFQDNSTNVSTIIQNNTITITAKRQLNNFLSAAIMFWDIPYNLRGQEVCMGCSSIVHNNENHNATIVCEYRDSNNNKISDPTVVGSAYNTLMRKYTIPENATNARLYFRIAQNVGTINVEVNDYVTYNNFYIQYPSNILQYQPYKGSIYTIDWSNNIGMVPGGYIDLLTGELVEEYAIASAKKSDFGDMLTPSSGGMSYRQTSSIYLPTASGVSWIDARKQQLFNYGIIANPWSETNYGNYIGVIITQDNYDIHYMRISEEVYQAMGENDSAIISYKLATPITHQLTHTQLKTLRGQNNIWSNANGPIELKYWAH